MADQAQNLHAAALDSPGKLSTAPEINSGCRVITVASGKGGVGKSSMVLNLALILTKMCCRVVVVDADLGLANMDILVNAAPRYTLADLLSGERSVEEIVILGPLNLKIVPGASGLYELANLDQRGRRLLLEKLKELERTSDLLLIDTGAGISRTVISFIGAADEFILLTTPEPTALTDAYGLMKVLAGQGLSRRILVVVNFVRFLQQGEQTFERLKRVAARYLPSLELHYLGEIQYDSAVSRAVHDFVPFALSHPHGAAARSLSRIALRLAPGVSQPAGAECGSAGFFQRLIKFFSVAEELS